ncbi:hypothetical protein SAMN04489740_2761 [Arthrobacter alpinus]|jgi:hypothetical protein|uniref:Uncharacterized protein n=1 Tax=Arthrobacter alpinus TaxID=656366 RepID=A0A1H5M5S6_9MICC|nr:hypothetical protein [Arthrobacter alpinus]SEE84560.1 hypothetical protein SAMN04489740_2761 [Arthrobacter alpinus]
MSAGTLGFEQEAQLANHHTMRAGYTSISSGTMHQLVAAIAADAFNVPLRDVRAGIHDGQGQVSVQLAVPLVIPMPPETAGKEQVKNRAGTLFERAAEARKIVAQRLHDLAGTSVGQVDIRFTGVHHGKPSTAGRVL